MYAVSFILIFSMWATFFFVLSSFSLSVISVYADLSDGFNCVRLVREIKIIILIPTMFNLS